MAIAVKITQIINAIFGTNNAATLQPTSHISSFPPLSLFLSLPLSLSHFMKLSKRILSPIRATKHGGAISLSFLRRRLRGSRGEAAAFFSRKKGPALENPEPSSPKVTCIGQVRVKSKKRVKQCRSLSKRRINGGEVSFRKAEQAQESESKVICSRSQRYSNGGVGGGGAAHQRWVHLPISVCDALRALGAEFSCLFPCKRSCFSMRWLVAINGGGRRRREIEVVETTERVSRRHVFEDIEVKEQSIQFEEEHEDEEEARLSISIPPKNALLLMRCRSDPMKMAALANRFSFDAKCEDHERGRDDLHGFREGRDEMVEALQRNGAVLAKVNDEEHEIKNGDESKVEMEEKEQEIEILLVKEEETEEIESNMSSFEDLLDQEKTEDFQEKEECEVNQETGDEEQSQVESQLKSEPEKTHDRNEEEKIESVDGNPQNLDLGMKNGEIVAKLEKESPVLPDCLLLMMYEPKLSMEVSKETWVRSTDFVRCRPRKAAKEPAAAKTGGACEHEEVKKRPSIDSKPKRGIPAAPPPKKKNNDQIQPARSSCSLPAASIAAVIEQKLVGEGKYAPFALTRCKSEPMRTAAEKLGVSGGAAAAGVGF